MESRICAIYRASYVSSQSKMNVRPFRQNVCGNTTKVLLETGPDSLQPFHRGNPSTSSSILTGSRKTNYYSRAELDVWGWPYLIAIPGRRGFKAARAARLLLVENSGIDADRFYSLLRVSPTLGCVLLASGDLEKYIELGVLPCYDLSGNLIPFARDRVGSMWKTSSCESLAASRKTWVWSDTDYSPASENLDCIVCDTTKSFFLMSTI